MSRSSNKDGLFLDTGLLRDHVSKLREQKRLAVRLRDNLAIMKSKAEPSEAYRYDRILRDVNRLIEYFSKMADVLADLGDDATQMSHELGGLVKDSTEMTRRITSQTLML